MILVRLLTEQQKDLLIGKMYNTDCYFAPVQDREGKWIISEQEVSGNIYQEFNWINLLPNTVLKRPFPSYFSEEEIQEILAAEQN